MTIRIAFFGDVVGRPGRRAVARVAARLRREDGVEFIVANAENATHGKGVDPRAAEELRDAGIDVLTSGNHVWQHRDIVPYLAESSRLLRPLNFPPSAPGRGWTTAATAGGSEVAVVNLIGRVFMGQADCPFRAIDGVLDEIHRQTRVVLVDMHAEATSEKVAMAQYLAGRVSAVIGSHTHVQTADERILAPGTAALTDAGMCGPDDSVLGVRTDRVLQRFITQMPVRFDVAAGPALVQGAIIDVHPGSGCAASIKRIRELAGE